MHHGQISFFNQGLTAQIDLVPLLSRLAAAICKLAAPLWLETSPKARQPPGRPSIHLDSTSWQNSPTIVGPADDCPRPFTVESPKLPLVPPPGEQVEDKRLPPARPYSGGFIQCRCLGPRAVDEHDKKTIDLSLRGCARCSVMADYCTARACSTLTWQLISQSNHPSSLPVIPRVVQGCGKTKNNRPLGWPCSMSHGLGF